MFIAELSDGLNKSSGPPVVIPDGKSRPRAPMNPPAVNLRQDSLSYDGATGRDEKSPENPPRAAWTARRSLLPFSPPHRARRRPGDSPKTHRIGAVRHD